jgi:succinate---hydroxymethylglutarate CoA-transferase
MTAKPLNGLRVLDLTRYLAGPYCTMLLGDLGAEVLKIEPPGTGDPVRTQGPPFSDGEGITFLAANRNKHSLSVDFNDADALARLRELAARADVFIENFRPGVVKKFQLDYESLRHVNPRLIYASISGMGADGPQSEERAFDVTIQAMGGYMSITGEKDRPPVKLGTSAFDIIAGMNTFSGILVALLERGNTGQGQHVETSLLEGEVAFLANSALEYLLGFGVPGKLGSEHSQLVPYRAFATRDGWIIIGAGIQNLFEKLMITLDREDLIAHPQFESLAARLANRDLVNATVEQETKRYSTQDLAEKLRAGGVPCAPIATIDQVLANPQVLHRQMVVNLPDTVSGRSVTLGPAVKYSRFDITEGWTAPPALNEGGEDVAQSWLASTRVLQLIDN